ncbi:MAG: hypothetical protein U1A78_29950 [Polyangia bacterium]
MTKDSSPESPSDEASPEQAAAPQPAAPQPAAPQPAAPQPVAPQPAPPPQPPKNQLRRRIEARMAELEAALERLGEDPARQKQARAIYMALKGARDSMSPGTGAMGPMEAAQMTRWLASTEHLGKTES